MSDNQIKASSAVREDGVYGSSKNSEFDYLLSIYSKTSPLRLEALDIKERAGHAGD